MHETLCEHKHMNAEDAPTVIPGTNQDIPVGGAELREETLTVADVMQGRRDEVKLKHWYDHVTDGSEQSSSPPTLCSGMVCVRLSGQSASGKSSWERCLSEALKTQLWGHTESKDKCLSSMSGLCEFQTSQVYITGRSCLKS